MSFGGRLIISSADAPAPEPFARDNQPVPETPPARAAPIALPAESG